MEHGHIRRLQLETTSRSFANETLPEVFNARVIIKYDLQRHSIDHNAIEHPNLVALSLLKIFVYPSLPVLLLPCSLTVLWLSSPLKHHPSHQLAAVLRSSLASLWLPDLVMMICLHDLVLHSCLKHMVLVLQIWVPDQLFFARQSPSQNLDLFTTHKSVEQLMIWMPNWAQMVLSCVPVFRMSHSSVRQSTQDESEIEVSVLVTKLSVKIHQTFCTTLSPTSVARRCH